MPSAVAMQVRRALLSVSDKAGLVDFGKALSDLGIEIVSTGGSANALREAGVPVLSVSEVTGVPEILDGRVKTLHPRIHGGILADLSKVSHRDELKQTDIAPIGLVAVNLYPFVKIAAEHADDIAAIIEAIDIGGVALLRAAAKNYASVAAVCDPADYDAVIADLRRGNGATSIEMRQKLAAKAFQHTAAYDAAIAEWFSRTEGASTPTSMIITGTLKQSLRYGENPHQKAALYSTSASGANIVAADQIQGKELSYNNIADADAAFSLISEFPPATAAAVIVKHANPCGAAIGSTLREAYEQALACDPTSAFGGIVALNGLLDEETAVSVLKIFTEVVIAPEATPEAIRLFKAKMNIRLLLTHGLLDGKSGEQRTFRSISGGFLVQNADDGSVEEANIRIVTKRAPTVAEKADMLFAMRVAKHVKSNAIVFAKDGATRGIGAGQMSRVDSVRLAVWKAANAFPASDTRDRDISPLANSAVASDAFFPFADALLAAADAGATAIIQPGGSIRDYDVIAAADERGLTMILTGMRHFRH